MCNHCEHSSESHTHHQKHAQNNTNLIIKILVSVILLISALSLDFSETFKLVLFLTAYIVAGGDVLLTALKNIFKGDVFDENFLMGIATLGAFAIKEYPEAVMVMVLYQIGEYFQHRAVEKSRKSISDLMDIRPDYANIEENGEIIKKSPENIHIGDIIIVKPGEKIPLAMRRTARQART